MLFCGCQNKNANALSTTEFTCEFSSGDTVGTVSCSPDAVTLSDIKVCGEDVGIVVKITAEKYTVATANSKAEYLYDNDDPFPLASFGLVLLNAANGQTQDCINISKKGLITSVTTENGSQYSLHSYKQT